MSHPHSPIDHSVDHIYLELPFFEIPLPGFFQTLGITRFVLMEITAAILICAIFIPLARHMAAHPVSRGRWWNLLEMLVVFVRDNIVKLGLHGHHAKAFLPFFLTLFFFILFNNLIGQIPGGATPTGNVNVTGVLAALVFGMTLFFGMKQSGVLGFWINLVPNLDVPMFLKPFLWIVLFLIELLSLLVKHVVLALRLFANMFAGHTVQAVVLGFAVSAGTAGWLWYIVTPTVIAASLALMMLELLVAVLQAYIFCLLAAMFIGSAIEPHH